MLDLINVQPMVGFITSKGKIKSDKYILLYTDLPLGWPDLANKT